MHDQIIRANATWKLLVAAMILTGCVSGSQYDSVQSYRYDKATRFALAQQFKSKFPDKNASLFYVLLSAERNSMKSFSSSGPRRNNSNSGARAVMHVHVERDYSPGFPIYRLIFKPHNFGITEMSQWGSMVGVGFNPARRELGYIAPLPRPLTNAADKTITTDWVFCPSCRNSKINSSPEGLRIAANYSRNYFSPATYQNFGYFESSVTRPPDLVTGNAARIAAKRLGDQIKGFKSKKRESVTANKTYTAFVKDYTASLPESEMKIGTCRTERSSSVGDIKSHRRALRINRVAERCRTNVLNNFNINSYRANYPALKRKEARLYSASYGIKRSEILAPEQVLKTAEKLVRNAKSLVGAFKSDVRRQQKADSRGRERARRERATREQILRNVANTNRAFQKQQRDVGTQQIDPTTGRVSKRSQREAEARSATFSSQRRRQGSNDAANNSSSGGHLTIPCPAEQRAFHSCQFENHRTTPKLGKRRQTPRLDCEPKRLALKACMAKAPKPKKSKPRSTVSR